MLGLLCIISVLLGTISAQTPPSAPQYSITCPYISANTCTLKPPIEAECKTSILGECSKAPSTLVTYYFITNVTGTNLTYRRFKDENCTVAEPEWTIQGQLGACIGPIDKRMGFDVFVTISLYNGTVNETTSSSSSPSTTVSLSNMTASTMPAATTASESASSSPTSTLNAQKTSAGSALPSPLFVVILGATLMCMWLFA